MKFISATVEAEEVVILEALSEVTFKKSYYEIESEKGGELIKKHKIKIDKVAKE